MNSRKYRTPGFASVELGIRRIRVIDVGVGARCVSGVAGPITGCIACADAGFNVMEG